MKRMYLHVRMSCFVLLLALLTNSARATTFTAALSGNFSMGSTWGGVAPGLLLSTDVVVIPPGITVTLDNNVTLSSTASLNVLGTLTSGTGGYALILTNNALTGSGTLTLDSLVLGLNTGYNFTGNITAKKLTSLGTNIATASNITVANQLTLASGTMNNIAANITLSSGAMIMVNGGNLSVSGSGMMNLTNTYHVTYGSTSATAGAELSGSGLTNVTVNIPSGIVTLSDSVNIRGMLTLTAGTLLLNNNNLRLSGNADIAASGSGSIASSAGSNISISTNNSLTGSLRFASAGNSVHNLNINISNSSASVTLGSDVMVSGTLNLQSGKIKLGASNLSIAAGGNIMGASNNSYVVTDGSGKLTMNLAAGNTATFAVGTTANYSPAIIVANTGSANGDVSMNVADKVYNMGTGGVVLSNTQPVVSATWYITSTASTGLNYNLSLMWNAGMEVNSFNRSNVYISHYMGTSWDVTTSAAAFSSGGMYMATRTNVTSLSPFTVADKSANMTSVKQLQAYANIVSVYPNPTTDVLYFGADVKAQKAEIYDVTGRLVKSEDVKATNSISVSELQAGYYNLRLYSNEAVSTGKFVKQ